MNFREWCWREEVKRQNWSKLDATLPDWERFHEQTGPPALENNDTKPVPFDPF